MLCLVERGRTIVDFGVDVVDRQSEEEVSLESQGIEVEVELTESALWT